jgi:predicted RNA methylase
MLEKMRTVEIDDQVKDILLRAQIEGNVLRIVEQLPRDVYERVNKVLAALGGKWDRRSRGHVFADDPAERVAQAVGTGRAVDIKKSFEFFETPRQLAELMVQRAAPLTAGMKILEPSGGRGSIAQAAREMCPECPLDVVEIEESNRKALKEQGFKLVGKDFLKFKKKGYDRVLMNPPFSKQQDIDHVLHALKRLKPGGVLVAIMSKGVQFRTNKKAEKFRQVVEERGGTIEELPAGTFEESGTSVATVMVTIGA